MRRYRHFSGMTIILASLIWSVPAQANGVDLATYTGVFNNLDQNAGSYMQWTITFGDLTAPLGTQYALIEFSFVIPEFTSYAWGASGDASRPANLAGTTEGCTSLFCDGTVHSANHYDNSPFGLASRWYFVDVYYPGVHSFDFHFTDPPGSGILAPMPFSLAEQNYLADGTPVGSPEGFSLTINPDGKIQSVNVTGMTLTGPGVGPIPDVPEPAAGVLMATVLAAMAAVRYKSRSNASRS